jgi:hypothetical protein
MEMIQYATKVNIMHIKENDNIYQFKQLNELTEEQESTKVKDNRNNTYVWHRHKI